MKLVFLLVIFIIHNVLIKAANPLAMLGKCISDHECEATEFCDHTGINPIGSCKIG